MYSSSFDFEIFSYSELLISEIFSPYFSVILPSSVLVKVSAIKVALELRDFKYLKYNSKFLSLESVFS